MSAETRHSIRIMTVRGWVDWGFHDRTTGKIVIVQSPNVALSVWMAATTVRLFVSGAHSIEELRWVAAGALLVCGLDELLRGVNPWRRAVGGTAAAYQIAVVVGRGS